MAISNRWDFHRIVASRHVGRERTYLMLEDLTPPNKTMACPVLTEAAKLEQNDREILLKAVADKAWPIPALNIALRNKGIKIAEKRYYDHRNQVCECWKN